MKSNTTSTGNLIGSRIVTRLLALAAAVGFTLSAAPCHAMHALDLTSAGDGPQFGNTFSVGWDFTVTQPIMVTHLGQFDPDSNPQTNTVIIYQRGGAKVVEVSVLATSPAEQSGNYSARYATVTPVVLPLGNYVIMSTQNGDNFIAPGGNPTATVGTGIMWNKGVALNGGSQAGPLPATAPANWPIENGTPFRYFGPTFKYDLYSTSPTITTSGTLAAVNTTLGTASPTPTSFTVAGASLTAGITVTPPAGFEVSQTAGGTSGYAGSGTAITVGSGGTIASTTIYVRLAASAAIGTYSGDIVCSSAGATSRNVATASSTVSAVPVGAIHAVDVNTDGGFGYNNTFSVGWDFTVSQTITVTSLGQFDPNANPPQDNTVAIYQRGGAKLVETTVLAISPAEPSGNYSARYAAISGLVLPPGNYVVFSTQHTVDFISPYGNPTATFGTGITWNRGVALGFGSQAGPMPDTAPSSWPIENTDAFRYFGPTFKYELYSSSSPTITTAGTLAAVNTSYGTASPSPTSFTVAGVNLTAGITITPPAGFEVSQSVGGTSGYAGSGTAITVGSGGTVASTTIYVRLAATAPLGTYSGDIVCSSTGATSRNVATVASTVSEVPVGVHALDVTSTDGNIGLGTGYSVGWEFTVSQAITVTALGQFDPNSNPKTNTVAIYQRVAGGGGAQLVSASVLNTSPAETSGVCPARYVAVAPVALPAGDYVIMSTQNGEDFIGPGGSPTVTMGAGITWTNGVAFSGAAGPLPATAPASWEINNNSPVRYFGPNFKYTASTPVPPTQLAITTVNGGANPTVGTAFDVVVQARDADGTPQNVTAATAVSLSVKTGTGVLGGTYSGTISANTNSVTISGVTYSKAESGVVLTATRTSGDNLTAGDSAAFTVDAQTPSNALGMIMPMGDSITLGVPVAGGYRDPLYTLLHNRGDTFTFVGSLTDYATTTLTNAGQTHHEGHSGYVIAAGGGRSGLDENLAGWIGPGAASPDKILLMIGSNDINIGYDMPNAPTRLSTLITHIYGYRPDVKLFVASIIPMSGHEPDVQAFNATIPGIVASHQALGRNAVYVPMYESMNIDTDLADGLHPNALGYQHMAQAWDTAIHLSNYSNWATANGVTGGVNGDSNNDGVQNGIAYFMRNAGRLTMPVPDSANKVTWPNGHSISSSEYGTTFWVETSVNLDYWDKVPVGNVNLTNSSDSVSYTLPVSGARQFCRLVVMP